MLNMLRARAGVRPVVCRALRPGTCMLQQRQLQLRGVSTQRKRHDDGDSGSDAGAQFVPKLDPSYDALLADMQMRPRARREMQQNPMKYEVDPADVRPAPAGGDEPGEDIRGYGLETEDDAYSPREERRSPAMVLGTKRIGMVVVPDALANGIQAAVKATDNPRDVRFAYLELLQPVKDKMPGGSRNLQRHAVARASAFLPAQYAATYNVLNEFKTRLGDITGPVMEISGGLGPGLWATSEVFGPAALDDFSLVHRTRFGLDLAAQLAENLPRDGDTPLDLTFKRDLSGVAGTTPQVVLATYALSVLPTARSRQTLLKQLLDFGADHIVLVDLAGEEGWTAMSQARTWLLSQSKPDAPLHITAPCPHDGVCPRIGTLEPCSFSQRLQRPVATRKTKHAKRGEEDVSYSYLIVSRGPRPSAARGAEHSAGRVGAVGREASARANAKAAGRTELREVEGGEGELEVVSIVPDVPETPVDTNPDATAAELRAEAYSWPRLVAPPMKRSGHVLMDACTKDERLERFTVAKSMGKQTYYDARKSGWGDLWPHGGKGTQVRARGVRRLTPAEEEVVEDVDGAPGLTGDAQLDALLRSLETGDALVPEDSADAVPDVLDASFVPKSKSGEEVSVGEASTAAQLEADAEHVKPTPAPQTNGTRPHRGTSGRREFSTSARAMSVAPGGPGATTSRPKVTVTKLQAMRDAGEPITMLTAYDYPTALLSARAGMDIVLVGDSLAQVALGYSSTVPLTLDEVVHHTRAVSRGCGASFLLVDVPFGHSAVSAEEGVSAAVRIMKEGGADGVKIEGGREILPLVRRLAAAGIPVMPHIGLQPQRVAMTGYRAQARNAAAAADLVALAREFEDAGGFALLVEAVPHAVATELTARVSIPTIGIGAGPGTSGQVLVITDLFGSHDVGPEAGAEDVPPKTPKFVRPFGAAGREMRKAVDTYVAAVKDRSYPAIPAETYTMPKTELAEFRRILADEGGEDAPKKEKEEKE